MLNYLSDIELWYLFKNHIPVDTIEFVLYMYPKWGDVNDTNACMYSLYFTK